MSEVPKDRVTDQKIQGVQTTEAMTTRCPHPGPIQREGKIGKAELEWRHIGSGIFARTFPMATRMITTTKHGPAICEIQPTSHPEPHYRPSIGRLRGQQSQG